MTRSGTALLLATFGCGAGPDASDLARQPIVEGTVLTRFADEIVQIKSTRTICKDCAGNPIAAPCTGSCTGTLLRNDVVLTAKHCVTLDASVTGPPLAPSDIRVFESKSATVSEPAYRIILHPRSDVDVALIFLGAGLMVNGKNYGHATPIYPYDPGLFEHQNLIVAGYGLDTQSSCGKVDHQLRYGVVELYDVSDGENPGGPVQPLKWMPVNGQIQNKGDSGSAAFGGLGFPAAALGVLNTCDFMLGIALGPCRSASPDDYRAWVETTLANRQRLFRDRFELDTSPFYEAVDARPCSEAPRWSWNSRFGVLVEASKARGCDAGPGGPMLLNKFGVYQNARLEVTLSPTMVTADDGSVGFVFRYTDPDHYYEVLFSDSTNQVTFYAKNGTWTRIASTSFDVDWDAFPTIGLVAADYRFVALYNGAIAGSATDSRYPVGRVGLTKRDQEGLVLDDFTIAPLRDLPGGNYWPAP